MNEKDKFDGLKSPYPVSDFEKSIDKVVKSSKHDLLGSF